MEGTTTYTYDTADRLISKATPAGTLNYTYDAAGHVASIVSSNPNGASMAYTYDSLNRLSTVVDNRLPSGQNTTTYTYDPASNLATATYPNGLVSTFTYDSLNRLTAMSTPPVSNYTYTLGATGNRAAATKGSGRTLNWSYDGIYRLTNETIASDPAGGNGAIAYVLDPVGNRTSDTSTVPSISSVTNSFNVDDLLAAETYDSNGNTLTSGGRTFTYDSENHLVSMNSGAVTLVYDGDGNRVAKAVGGVTTQYLVDDLNPTGFAQVIEEVAGGAVQREYTYGLQRISQNQPISGTWTPNIYGYDGGGTVRQLTNLAGAVTDTYNYDAFGNLLNSTGSTPNNYRYRGEQYDPDLNLYYLRARYYNPLTGRFLSRDPEDHNVRRPNGIPLDPRELHKYLYANGDPLNRVDPSGRDALITYADLGFESELTATRVADTFSCVSGILFTSTSLLMANSLGTWDALGAAATAYGCVSLVFPEEAETEWRAKLLKFKPVADYGTCAIALGTLVHDLNAYSTHSDVTGAQVNVDGLSAVVGCVTTQLSAMFGEEAQPYYPF